MHFSIPDTEEIKDGSTSYTAYNIHINGVFHCKARYKQLRQFHEELRKEFGSFLLPDFPKKKLLALSAEEVEQRRSMLERYIQLVSQDPQICNSDVFNSFLLTAQQDSQVEDAERVTLHTFLMNGHKISISLMSTDQTDDVLESVAKEIEIPDDYVYYFGLFLVKKEGDGDTSMVRKLQEFESPYLSLNAANKSGVHRIVLRKCYWDSSYDDDLLENKVTMNLLYVQANSDIERNWILATKEQLNHLENLRKKGSKREFLRMCRTLKYYGYMQFQPCKTDYPAPHTYAIISAGQKELNFRVSVQVLNYRIFYRELRLLQEIEIHSVHSIYELLIGRSTFEHMAYPSLVKNTYPNSENDTSSSPPSSSSPAKSQLELSFEYLMSKNNLQWVAIISDQAMLISMCLQSMVDELIMRKQNKKFKKPEDRQKIKRINRPLRHLSREQSYGPETEDQGAINKAIDSVKKLSDKIGKVGSRMEETVTENDAFEEIGDDDL